MTDWVNDWTAEFPEGATDAPTPAVPTADEDDGWDPIDMAKVFSGDFSRPKATLGRREDGIALIYAAKEHVVSAEPESAKTWFMCKVASDVLETGGTVAYIDFEDDELTIGMRTHWLGSAVQVLCNKERFRYVRPVKAVTWDRYLRLLNFGTDEEPQGPTIVIIDGTTEGYGLHGWDILDNKDAPKWRQTYIKPALAVGAATLASDHVVKNRDARNGFAIGAQHKKAGLTGVLYELQVLEPFGIGMRGKAKLIINKDRNGDLRQHGITEGKATYFADLVLDATAGELECPKLWLFPPQGDEGEGGGSVEPDPIVLKARAIEHILTNRGPMLARDLRSAIEGRGSDVDRAVQYMLNLGTLHEGKMLRGNARLRHLPNQCREGMECFDGKVALHVAA
jgi:hypothetical protein